MMPMAIGRLSTPSEPAEAVRVLVDRLWPRGIAKASAPWDIWAQAMSPSTDLRRWYGHDPERYEEFRRRYVAELTASLPNADVDEVMAIWRERPVKLVTASREVDHSHVPVLREFLMGLSGVAPSV